MNPYVNIDPVDTSSGSNDPGKVGLAPVQAVMTDGGSPFGSGCLYAGDEASCGGIGFGYLPALGNSNPFASIDAGLQAC